MKVYSFDSEGLLVDSREAQLDQLESKKAGKEVYLLPGNATFVTPGAPKKGFVQRWTGKGWVEQEIPAEVKPEPPPEFKPPEAEPVPEVDPEVLAETAKKLQELQAKAEALREKLIKAKASGITSKNSPEVLADLIEYILGG